MGTTASVPELTQKQKDLKHLAGRCPFSDAELSLLYDLYHHLVCHVSERDDDPSEGRNFLQDVTIYITKDDPECEKRIKAVQKIQTATNIDFNRLFRSAFAPPSDPYHHPYLEDTPRDPNDVQAATNPRLNDEYARRTRLEAFFEGMSNMGRRGSKAAVQTLVSLCDQHYDDKKQCVDAHQFVKIAYQYAMASSLFEVMCSGTTHDEDYDWETVMDAATSNSDMNSTERTVHLQSLSRSLVQRVRNRHQQDTMMTASSSTTNEDKDGYWERGLVQVADVVDWADSVVPMMGSILPTLQHYWLFPTLPFPSTRSAFHFPIADMDSVILDSTAQSSPVLFTFGCLSASLGGTWHRLYSSGHDGLSFNRLLNALLGYSGPTLLLIRATGQKDALFGAFTGSPWKESKDFYGNSDSFLFQMSPTTAIYRPSGNGKNFMYCNSNARSRGYDQQPHGVGFGGDLHQPRLFISESLDECYAGSQDLTFENGNLLPLTDSGTLQKQFEIDSLEVWGVGGDEVVQSALGARAKAREHRDEGIRRARKVDKAQFLDDFRSGVISSKAFQYREQIDGRADQDVKERHTASYEK